MTIKTIISMSVKPLFRTESSEFGLPSPERFAQAGVRNSEYPILNLQILNFELNSNFLISLDSWNPGPLGPFNHEILTFPVYWVTVIVPVIPPAETVTELPPPPVGSPRELKVNVIVVPVVTPDGSRPEGSRLLVEGMVAGNV
jgi:hypothetical protein